MKKWNIVDKSQSANLKSQKLGIEDILKILLQNRGLANETEIQEFLNPSLENVNFKSVEVDKKQLVKALKCIADAKKDNKQIIIFGDYDVDGICATTILWEALYKDHKKTMPYIPNRVDEGYGLSIKAIDNLLLKYPDTKVIITVDNGIVAHEAVEYANLKKIDVIITDHHVGSDKFPKAHAIIHTTKLCGAGIAYLLAQEIQNKSQKNLKSTFLNHESFLELATIATIADLVPLTKENRTIVYHGLKSLQKTTRIGILELYKEAAIEKEKIGVYEIGHIISPRINAMGRLMSGMDSLRLLCARNHTRAKELALILSNTNRSRQNLTEEAANHAIENLRDSINDARIAFVSHIDYNVGIIGLIASKLVEKYYRPSFAISIGEKISKGSARSVSGVNIIEMIRSVSHTIVQAGGHPMAAGFTVETARLEEFRLALEKRSLKIVLDEHLVRTLKVDCEIPFSSITTKLYKSIQELAPFGMGNPEPVFVTHDVTVVDATTVGKEKKHLKLKLSQDKNEFDAIAFGFGGIVEELNIGELIDVAYTIDENTWNGRTKLQLKVRDIKPQ